MRTCVTSPWRRSPLYVPFVCTGSGKPLQMARHFCSCYIANVAPQICRLALVASLQLLGSSCSSHTRYTTRLVDCQITTPHGLELGRTLLMLRLSTLSARIPLCTRSRCCCTPLLCHHDLLRYLSCQYRQSHPHPQLNLQDTRYIWRSYRWQDQQCSSPAPPGPSSGDRSHPARDYPVYIHAHYRISSTQRHGRRCSLPRFVLWSVQQIHLLYLLALWLRSRADRSNRLDLRLSRYEYTSSQLRRQRRCKSSDRRSYRSAIQRALETDCKIIKTE